MDIQSMLGIKKMQDVQSLLCVQPHPDDNEVGAGGTIAMLAERGCRITFVTVTDGRYGAFDPSVQADRLIQTRRQERDAAGEKLGVTKQMELGFEDGGDYTERAVMEALIPILREEQPEMVLTVDAWMPYEAHPDHQKTGRAVAAAVLAAENIAYPEAGRPFGVPQVGFYGTSYPNTYVDITPHWETKLEAILTHRSQFENEEWPLLQGFFTYQANEWYKAMCQQQGGVGQVDDPGGAAAADPAGSPGDALSSISAAEPGESHGFAEAFKVLSRKQLHFFPWAVYM